MSKKRTDAAPTKASSFFTVKAVILTAVMIALYIVLTNAELGGWNTYGLAYDSRIGFYAERMDTFAHIGSWRQRMFMRHVANYEIPLWISENKRPGDTILLPPAEYADRYLTVKSSWTDPRIFTYFADFQPIVAYADTARRNSVNAYISLGQQSISIVRKGSDTNIDSLLSVFEEARRSKGADQ